MMPRSQKCMPPPFLHDAVDEIVDGKDSAASHEAANAPRNGIFSRGPTTTGCPFTIPADTGQSLRSGWNNRTGNGEKNEKQRCGALELPHLCFARFTQTCVRQAFEHKCFFRADQRLNGGGYFSAANQMGVFEQLLENRKYTDHQLQNVADNPADVHHYDGSHKVNDIVHQAIYKIAQIRRQDRRAPSSTVNAPAVVTFTVSSSPSQRLEMGPPAPSRIRKSDEDPHFPLHREYKAALRISSSRYNSESASVSTPAEDRSSPAGCAAYPSGAAPVVLNTAKAQQHTNLPSPAIAYTSETSWHTSCEKLSPHLPESIRVLKK